MKTYDGPDIAVSPVWLANGANGGVRLVCWSAYSDHPCGGEWSICWDVIAGTPRHTKRVLGNAADLHSWRPVEVVADVEVSE